MKKKLLFVITQFYKGGAEMALLNLFKEISPDDYEVDFLVFDQVQLPGAVSLMEEIPRWITVCDAAQNEGLIAWVKKVFFRIVRKITKHQLARSRSVKFVQGKTYDLAVSYGEWMSPEFVAQKVQAHKKAVWIHTDIDKSYFLDDTVLFRDVDLYSYYIFVSLKSMEGAVKRFPFLKGKACLVHNMCDDEGIRRKGLEKVERVYGENTVVTVANIRPEKNHLRQVEAMHIVRQHGIDFTWINIGSTFNALLTSSVRKLVEQYGLQDQYILHGASANPYTYMKQARAVTVLSDYESWSMVITEAKILGTPVIATATSGAQEQIQDGFNGILTDFTAQDIADNLIRFFTDAFLENKLADNLKGFTTRSQTLQEFYMLMDETGAETKQENHCET